MTDKQAAIIAINSFPDDISAAEIVEALQINEAIKKGQADVKAGRIKSHAAVEKFFDQLVATKPFKFN